MNSSSHDSTEARIAELATGYAHGELDEHELRELYDFLRDEHDNSSRAAQITWQTLGMVTDIRAQVSTNFQDTVTHRLQTSSLSGRFTNAVFKKLGLRTNTLDPVAIPQSTTTVPLTAWLIVALITGMLLAIGGTVMWSNTHRSSAIVTALYGSATLAGQTLTAGTSVDQGAIVVKPSAQMTLLWNDGSSATIASPSDGSEAAITVRHDGLLLQNGQAWISGRRGFMVLLPDRRCHLDQDDTYVAVEVSDHHGYVGVRRGQVSDERLKSPLGEHQGSGPAGAFRWQWQWDALSGTLGQADRKNGNTLDNILVSPPDWRLSADLTWRQLHDRVRVVFDTGTGAGTVAGTVAGAHHALELRMTPGLMTVMCNGQEQQRLAITGVPLLGRQVALRQSANRTLTVSVDTLSLSVPLSAPIMGYRLQLDGNAMVKVDTFYPLPNPRPPVAIPGW